MNKRASLNMAIEVIVVVVIAMTLLGLGLGFVRENILNIKETTLTVQEQIKQQILDDLRVGNKKLSFPTERYTLQSGVKKDMAIGVQNLEDKDLNFEIQIYKKEGDTFTKLEPTPDTEGEFFWDSSEQTLGLGEARVYGILHQAKTEKGTYLYKVVIQISGEDKVYDSKSFFVTVV